MTMPFSEIADDGTVYFHPRFKFLSYEYAKALLNNGQICIPALQTFRNASLHQGLIYDGKKGQATVIRGGVTTEIDMGHVHAYCMTQHFLSDSFEWALKEGKDVGVIIGDVEVAATLISNEIEKARI